MYEAMYEPMKLFLASIVGPAFVAWLVSYFTVRHRLTEEQAKGIIRAEIEEGLVKLKADFEQKQDKLRHDLHRESVMHEVKFRKLYDNAAEGVSKIFLGMSKLRACLDDFAFCVENDPDRRSVSASSLELATREFKDACTNYQLFLPASLFAQIKQFDDLVFSAEMACVHAGACDNIWKQGVGDRKQAEEKWNQAKALLKTQLSPLLEGIHADFQKLLGYSNISMSP
jgi:hypothetical protein